MSKTLTLPGALLFVNECVDQRVFNFQEVAKINDANEQWLMAKQRIENMEKLFNESLDERKQLAFEEGYQAGLKQASENMIEVINQCQAVEPLLCELAVSAIKKVLDDLPDDVLLPSLVSNAVRKINNSHSHITVFVHAQCLKLVKSHLNQSLRESPCLKLIEVRQDPRMKKHDCRLETNFGVVNANLIDQLDSITRVFCGERS